MQGIANRWAGSAVNRGVGAYPSCSNFFVRSAVNTGLNPPYNNFLKKHRATKNRNIKEKKLNV
jgi:hypothetical protein